MRRFGMKALAIIAIVALQAGSPTGPRFVETAPLPGQSLVHLYRAPRFYNSAGVITIYVNRDPVAALPNGGYYSLSGAPGLLEFEVDFKVPLQKSSRDRANVNYIHFRLQTLPDAIYYVEISFAPGGSIRLEEIQPDRALDSLRSLRRAKDLRGRSNER